MNAFLWLYKSPNRFAVALRTLVQTVAAVIVAAWIADGDGRVSTVPDVVSAQADFAGGAGLLAFLAALGWHAKRSTPAA